MLAERVAGHARTLLAEAGGITEEVGALIFGAGRGILSAQPNASRPGMLVIRSCQAARGAWQQALWAATAMEFVMAAADLLDDVADGEVAAYPPAYNEGALLTVAAGLLSLGHAGALRCVADGASPETAVAVAGLLASGFAQAAEGQAQSLVQVRQPVEALAAYRLAVGKSGPLGALATGMGARVAGVGGEPLDLFQRFGLHLAVYNQLVNDAHDAAPTETPLKRDVRDGQATVPLAFAGSHGAPSELAGDELWAWERQERERIEAEGGIALALGLAEAEKRRALDVLQTLKSQQFVIDRLQTLLT